MNLAAILLAHGRGRPDQEALVEAGRRLSYAQVGDLVRRYAGRLATAGIGPADRVGLALRDHADHLLLHYAVALLGATIVPVDHRWTAAERDGVASAFGCRRVVVEADDPAAGSLPALAFDADWRAAAPFAGQPVDEEALPVVLSLSSGTTGAPTGALVSHRELYERFVSQWAGMGINGFDRYLVATPLYFGGGRSFAMSFLAAGATVIFCPPPASPETLLTAARRHRATVAFLVPTQVRRLIDAAAAPFPALPELRVLITSGAATLPDERRRAMERLTPGLMDYYATSEGGGIAVLAPHEQLSHGRTVGRPAFRVEIEVVDEADRPLGPGEVGRLRYRGPGVSTRLVDAGGAIIPADPAGWFVPGDLARLLASGHVELVGRVKDVIIRAGVNIYPAEIEAALAAHPAVAEAAVFGLPDRELGESIAAAIALRCGHELTPQDAQAHLGARLAPYKLPRRLVVLPALPRNQMGKIIRAELVRLVAEAAPE